MPMNIQRRTSNIANIVSYDANGNVTIPAGFTVAGLNAAGYVKTLATGSFFISANIPGSDVSGAALTKTDDTNVTLTLGGTPATALLRAASLTLGWTGQLTVSRGGTGAGTLTGVVIGNGTGAMTAVSSVTALQVLRVNATGTGYEFATISTGGGTVTTVSVVTANGVSGTVATASTTPAITLTLGAITPTSVNSVVISGSATPTLAVTGTSSISGSNTGDNAVNSLYSGLVSNATHTGDATGATALTVVGLRGVALPALGASAGFLRYTGTGTNTWVFDTSTYLTTAVTSVALSLPNMFTVSGSPVTTTGTLTATLASQTANQFFAAPNGSAGAPSFRAILAADIPTLNQNTTGSAGSVANSFVVRADSGTTEGTDIYTFNGSAAKNINIIAGTNISITKAAGSWTINTSATTNTGTVTSVAALTLGTTGTDLSSTVATGTTTPVITLNVPTASAANRGALSAADWSTFNGKQAALNGTGFVKATGTTISYDNTTYQSTAEKGVANGYASLNSSGQVPSTQLPSYVDDVLEFANLAAFPATGEAGKIYVTADTNKTYRWTGTVYVEISASPGSTDAVTEGTTNLYFTNARARAAVSFTAGSGAYNSTTGVFTIPTNTNQLTNGAGFITGNQSITWTAAGDISGTTSGTTSITPTLTVTGLRGVALPVLGASAGFLRYTGTGTNTWVFDTSTYLTTAVTSVALSLPAIFTVSGSPVTTSGTLTATLASQTANQFFAAPNGTAGAPVFRAIVAADIPTLNQNTTGSAGSVANSFIVRADSGTTEGTDIYTFNGSAGKNLNIIAGTNISITKAAGSWTIASTGTGLNGTGYVKMSGTTVSYVASIPNTDLANSSITVQGSAVSLGGSVNVINGTGFVKATGTTISYDNSTYALSSHTHSYFIGTTAVQTSSANQALTGITGITFAAEASDAASITTTISSTSTFFDFNLTDDNNNDEWRWRFTPSGQAVYNAMRLVPSTNTTSNLIVSGTIASSNFSGSSSGTNTGDQTLSGLGGQPQLNGTGFVKASGTTISYDNNTYYLASNPSGYTNNTGTVTSVGGTGTVSGLTLSGSVTTSGNLTLGGTLSLTAANVNAVGAITNNTSGTAGSTPVLTASGALTTQQGSGTVIYSYALTNPQTGLFAASDNANSILTVNRHPGDYYSQLGFSSNGNLYYRNFVNTAINTSQGWQTIWTSSSLTNLNQLTNGPGYTSNTGTVTSVGGTGTVSGLTLSGTVTTSGNLTLGGTLSASIDNITDEHRLFNNMGDNHGTRSSFDATIPTYNFGWRFVQGTGNGPGVNSATQYYSVYVGLGNDYPATGAGSYGMQIAFPRNVSNPYIAIRYNENNGLAAWQKISAGYADTAGALTSMNISQFTNNSGYITAAQTYYIGTTQNALNRSSAAQTLTGVSIDGNAVTASSTTFLKSVGDYNWAQSTLPASIPQGLQLSFVGPGVGEGSWQNYGTVLAARSYSSGGGGSLQMYVPYGPSNGGNALQVRFGNYSVDNGNAWTAWKTLLQSDNYNSYSPTLTGGGASGTWGINITGNADTVDGYHASVANSGLMAVVRDSSGDIFFRYSFSSYVNTTDDVSTGTITNIIAKFGDNYHRSASAAKVQSFLGLGSAAYTPTSDYGRAYSADYSFHGTNAAISTATFISILSGLGAFSQPYWTARGSWCYACNGYINDTGLGDIHLAGCTVEVMGNSTNFTIRVHTPTTSSSGLPNREFIYVQNSTGYSPGWRVLLNNVNYNDFAPTKSGGGASGTWGISISGNAASVSDGMYLSAGQYVTGIKYFKGNKGSTVYLSTSDSATLQAFSDDGGTAFMSFHRGGYYAVNMGLDPDNVFRIGGWSAGYNRLQMDMSGNLTMAGDITAYSDARVKTNVETVQNALDKTLRMRGVTYNRTDSDDTKTKVGVIAQEMLEVLPEVVNQDNAGMYNVSYGNIVGVLIEAIKEQQTQIQDLKKQIEFLAENR